MKLTHIACLSAVGLLTVACTVKTESASEGDLATSESQLVADDSEGSELDEDMEAAEEGMSGATDADPNTPADGASDGEIALKIRENAGKFFRPAGCITTTVEGNVATHVFNGCTGPFESATFNGTVKSTIVRSNGVLTITNEATNFQITSDGKSATLSGSRVVTYAKSGSVVTRTRTGNWTGKTASGNDVSHQANFTTTWDPSSRCITREGNAKSTVGGRSLERTMQDYKRCGVGRLGCPSSGKLTLVATNAQGTSLTLSLEFLGGRDYQVTRPSGAVVSRKLVCIQR